MTEPAAKPTRMSRIASAFRQPVEQAVPLVLGLMLIATGVVLLLERARTEGLHILWPLVLVLVGAARIGAGPSESQDQGWWLVGIGSWLLFKIMAPSLFHQVAALIVVGAGVFTWRASLNGSVSAAVNRPVGL